MDNETAIVASPGDCTKEQLMELLEVLNAAYQRIRETTAQKNKLQATIQSTYSSLHSKKTSLAAGAIVFGVLAVGMPWGILAVCRPLLCCGDGGGSTCMIIITFLAFAGASVGCYFPYRSRSIELARASSGTLAQMNEQVDALQARIDSISRQVGPIYQLLTKEYAAPDAVTYMLNMLRLGRAKNFADASYLWDEEQHRRSIEAMQKEQLDSQLRTEEKVNEIRDLQIASTAADIATAAGVNSHDDDD